MRLSTVLFCAFASLAATTTAQAGGSCGVSIDKGETTSSTLVVSYNVSGCPALSKPAGAKARVCIEKEGTNSFACQSYQRSNAPTVGTLTGSFRFIGMDKGAKYRVIGYYAKRTGDNYRWAPTNYVLMRTKG